MRILRNTSIKLSDDISRLTKNAFDILTGSSSNFKPTPRHKIKVKTNRCTYINRVLKTNTMSKSTIKAQSTVTVAHHYKSLFNSNCNATVPLSQTNIFPILWSASVVNTTCTHTQQVPVTVVCTYGVYEYLLLPLLYNNLITGCRKHKEKDEKMREWDRHSGLVFRKQDIVKSKLIIMGQC